jgi:hypothetical protein
MRGSYETLSDHVSVSEVDNNEQEQDFFYLFPANLQSTS